MTYTELDIGLSDEARAMHQSAMKFAVEVLRPAGVELDGLTDPQDVVQKDSKLFDVLKKLRELGYHKVDFPAQVGGMKDEVDPITACLLSEAMGYGDAGLAMSLNTCAIPFKVAALGPGGGGAELAKSFCDEAAGGLIGCLITVKPGAATDLQVSEQEIVIGNYTAPWVANASIATHALLLIPPDPGSGREESAAAVIPLDTTGVSRGKALGKVGQRALNQADVVFEGVEIPASQIITADPEKAAHIADAAMAEVYCAAGQVCTGLSQAAFDAAHEYAKDRIQGGVTINKHNNVKLKLFNMFSTVESSRALARRVSLFCSSSPGSGTCQYAAALRVMNSEAALKVATEAVQVLGGNGLAKEYPTEKMLRDARSFMVIGGTNEELACAACDRLPRAGR